MLSLIAGEKTLPGETLVIFDEIQECPAALNALKYFKEKANEYHIISAGSLLGTLLAQPKSYPVGMVNLLDLSPLMTNFWRLWNLLYMSFTAVSRRSSLLRRFSTAA